MPAVVAPTLTAEPVPTCSVTPPGVSAAALTAVPVELAIWPIWSARTPCEKFTEIVSPTLAPTWKVLVPKVPSRMRRPLKVVCCAIREISAVRCCTSASSAARSEALLVALADCTASSRMRCRLLFSSASAPSAVWASEMPSLALRIAWFRPRICVVKRSEIARPAASSLALLMRRPEDSRCSAVARLDCELDRLRCAFSDRMLVLITCPVI